MLKYIIIAALLIVVTGIFTNACSRSPATTGQTTTPPPAASGTTAGQLAEAGKAVFANRCAGCHGASGQGVNGPAIIGTGVHLSKYGTAQGLLDYVDTVMPANAPGSLSAQNYLEVVSFLLVQNNYILASAGLNAGGLQAINLNK